MSTLTSPLIHPRPFLKWAGGKAKLISQYTPYFPQQFRTYHEPFLGGGAIFFHLNQQHAVLTDINQELVNVYRCVRDQVEAVIDSLNNHQQHHQKNQQIYYYQIRATRFQTPVERAARILYLNKTCFNGLYRENSKGGFNVPLGRYKNPKICDPELLYAAANALKTARIQVSSFDQVLAEATSPEDFVYFDPPYHPISSTSSFTAYNRYSFHQADQVRLAQVFRKLANWGVQVMLSNSDCPLIRDLYQDFLIHEIKAARTINSNARKRGEITELLITSY
ncbi:MAG: DNA adenine methylase [Oscillatoriales cyanobacterium RM2_1_1]|nr:DNA adenine methylase [Oscillatoriales cyanobacterium SM2_3_0]NJO46121.1 DNA adenine methylase [Oscillatoriales cyanobacterium RM2_1_1]